MVMRERVKVVSALKKLDCRKEKNSYTRDNYLCLLENNNWVFPKKLFLLISPRFQRKQKVFYSKQLRSNTKLHFLRFMKDKQGRKKSSILFLLFKTRLICVVCQIIISAKTGYIKKISQMLKQSFNVTFYSKRHKRKNSFVL
jgi:hypothetical protein